MVTLGMNVGSFSLSKPRGKLSKSLPLVTIFLLIGELWRILYMLAYIVKIPSTIIILLQQ